MLGLYVTVPVACFRKGFAREFLETEILPPPSTCYGFLLSLVGESDRQHHVGCRVTAALIAREPQTSTVLRTVWRLKHRDREPGASGNMRPDFQQLLTGLELAIWIDSAEELGNEPSLEERVATGLKSPESIQRYGGLSLGESTHLVNDLRRIEDCSSLKSNQVTVQMFAVAERGRLTFPVWVDHVGSAQTRYVTGQLTEQPAMTPPDRNRMPQICP
ncbi:type I-MYXAN CRISPR-associated protein Cas5/Cmx5/DevS [Thalassoroseus pseudoceratinae]|uniref:type I-MYXAN CRISPR-associated protein Cas5/Cmx5/DevS n=1 Tax=Thalassoroseus pseudoceratinae TaxID=2713176 RepID=UPI001422A34F|nr:type I-MYXAN CRISPR-associated protein Cas5/Cmx5/DevS [Thalassoroseus pseudoceratinae]